MVLPALVPGTYCSEKYNTGSVLIGTKYNMIKSLKYSESQIHANKLEADCQLLENPSPLLLYLIF